VDLRHLRCFVAVAEELHFGRAARRLHVAQPAVSQTIAALERELGVHLFERSSRDVSLTPTGQSLLPYAVAVLERADGFRELAERLRSGAVGRVTIGVAAALPPKVLPDLLAAVRRESAGVRAVAKSLTGADPGAALATGSFDLVLARGSVSAPGVASVLVSSEPVGLAMRADHPLAALETVPPSALNGEPLVAFARRDDPAQFDRLLGALYAAGLAELGEIHESPAGAVEASLRLVAAGEAVSLKLQSEVDAFGDPAVVWRPLCDVDLSVDVHLAWRIDLTSPAARAVTTIASRLQVASSGRG
jgi:DNA-binding transcriptional LysR family regulator